MVSTHSSATAPILACAPVSHVPRRTGGSSVINATWYSRNTSCASCTTSDRYRWRRVGDAAPSHSSASGKPAAAITPGHRSAAAGTM